MDSRAVQKYNELPYLFPLLLDIKTQVQWFLHLYCKYWWLLARKTKRWEGRQEDESQPFLRPATRADDCSTDLGPLDLSQGHQTTVFQKKLIGVDIRFYFEIHLY